MSAIHITWAPSTTPGLFDVTHEGKWLCKTRQPFLDGARALMAMGVAGGSEKLTGGRTNTEIDLSCTRVSFAAGLTVLETPNGPAFRKFQPFTATIWEQFK